MSLAENVIVKPGLGYGSLDWPHRVLAVDRDLDLAVLIKLPGAPGKKGKKGTHVGGPKGFNLAALEDELKRGILATTSFEPPGWWSMTDDDYLESSPTEKERKKRKKRLEARDRSWNRITPIVGDDAVRTIALDTRRLGARVLKQAEACGVNTTTIYRTLHIYLASGGVRSSLIPQTHLCGNPGKEKPQTRKLGRTPRVMLSGAVTGGQYVLQEGDTQRLANGNLLAIGGRTLHDAYLFTCSVYWSKIGPTESGEMKVSLLPPQQRPTFPQFKYWGQKLNKLSDRKRRIGTSRWAEARLITAGSTQDQVRAVGQMAMLDSTSTDVYLTSLLSRHKKLPPMHRTIVKEVRSTAVIGFYVGWENPSSATALQAVLSSAENKVEICKRFGIDINDEDWPYLLCKLFLADNGEMKAKVATEAELEFRFGIEYVKAYSGQSKSDVENQHHTDHKRLDHKLPGTTRGKQRERGEQHPAESALWNYYEYMHEFLLMVIEYNNEEVPHLAPTAMLKEGVRPTRINILKWMMARNMRADIPYCVEQLRAFTLPSVPAVMTKTGIHLLMEDGIRRLPGHRFYSPCLQNSPSFVQAAKNSGSVNVTVKCREDDLSHVWFASSEGLIRVPNVQADDELQREGTRIDWTQWIESEDVRKDLAKYDKDQAQLNTLLRREATTKRAKKELAKEEESFPKKPSKTSVRSGLRQNREDELALLRDQDQKRANERREEQPDKTVRGDYASSQASSEAMDEFMSEYA